MDRQYVYSVTHTKQEYEIAWIVEWDTIWLNSELINEAIAWNKISKIKITWNYNGKFLKLSTGGIDYVLNVPSIITSTWGTLDYILANNWLAYNSYSNLPLQYDWSPYATMWESPEITLVDAATVIAYSGSFTTLAADTTAWETARTELITNAQTAYTWSPIATDYQIAEIVNVDLSDTWAVDYIASAIVNNDLWFDDVEIPVYTASEWEWAGVSRFAWYDEVGALTQLHMKCNDVQDGVPFIDHYFWTNILIDTGFQFKCNAHDIWIHPMYDYADIRITKIEYSDNAWTLIDVPFGNFFLGWWEIVDGVIRNTSANNSIYLVGHEFWGHGFSNTRFRITYTATELADNTWFPPPPMTTGLGGWWWEG